MGSGTVSWSSKLQSLVALSTTEAEYISAVEAGKEICWMCNLVEEMGFPMTTPSVLRIDNQSAISVAKNPEHHGRMKQLDLWFYWLRDKVEEGVIAPNFVPTAEMPADLLTKPLDHLKDNLFCKMMGLERTWTCGELQDQGGLFIMVILTSTKLCFHLTMLWLIPDCIIPMLSHSPSLYFPQWPTVAHICYYLHSLTIILGVQCPNSSVIDTGLKVLYLCYITVQ